MVAGAFVGMEVSEPIFSHRTYVLLFVVCSYGSIKTVRAATTNSSRKPAMAR
jgi:hypothetical protein